jgi:hypothetical protein
MSLKIKLWAYSSRVGSLIEVYSSMWIECFINAIILTSRQFTWIQLPKWSIWNAPSKFQPYSALIHLSILITLLRRQSNSTITLLSVFPPLRPLQRKILICFKQEGVQIKVG